jgi:hypothetical protein
MDCHKNEYRKLCLDYLCFIRKFQLCDIKLEQKYEAVLVEFNILPHIEFLIRNTIYKLGENWSHTIICGNINYEFVNNLCKEINTNIKIIKLNHDNLTPCEYSNLLCTIDFWELLHGEKILLYQEDSCIFRQNIEEFIKWDFIGAPLNKTNDTLNLNRCGLSLRTRKIMIDIINKIKLEDTKINSLAINYMKKYDLQYCPEHVYFYKNMQEYNIGLVSDWKSAFNFLSGTILNPNSFGGHCFWLNDSKWEQRVLNLFDTDMYTKYKCKSHILLVISNFSKELLNNPNFIDFDLEFMKESYPHLRNMSYKALIKYIQSNNYNNHFFHFKQLLNLFQNKIDYFENKNNKIIKYENKLYPLQEFIKSIDKYTYEDFKRLTIQFEHTSYFKSNKLLILVFIGNNEKGIEILDKIKRYSQIETFSIVFCVKYNLIDIFQEKIIEYNFDSFIIYSCNEFGNDIIPSLLVYDEISKMIDFTYIIKLHTKTHKTIFNNYTDFLLSKSINELLCLKSDNCNCIGETYINLNEDNYTQRVPYNGFLIDKYQKEISKTLFVPYSIFFSFKNNFTNVLDFLVKNYKTIFLQNTYDDNSINYNASYVHFLERLFGIL